MRKSSKGVIIAREVLLIITFCLTVANVILMIVELASGFKSSRGFVRIKDSDEMPF